MRYFLGLFIAFCVGISAALAQTDDLMITEYVDWQGGSGWGVKIHNPTNSPMDLSDYHLVRYRDGDPAINAIADMTGMLSSGQHRIFGNSSYCDQCPNGCTTVTGIVGTNGEDALAITFGVGNENIDMVGAWGVQTELTVQGISDAVFEHRLTRNNDNCVRYFDKAGTTVHSWPDNVNENVTTWEITTAQCLTTAPFVAQLPTFSIAEDTTICAGTSLELDFSSLGFDAYSWIGQSNETPEITITDSGSYTLEVSSNFCLSRETITVSLEECDSIPVPTPEDSLVFIPNIITPNADNMNDAFVLKGFTETVQLTVYNRWGAKVFESVDYQNDWLGDDLSDGIYFYQVTEGFASLSGWVQIRR